MTSPQDPWQQQQPPPSDPYAAPPPGSAPPPPPQQWPPAQQQWGPAQQQWGQPPPSGYEPYAQPQWGGPPSGYGYGYPTPAPSNGMGVASLVLGILGLLGCWVPVLGPILALVGVILGAVALSQFRKRGASNGMALAGLILGALGLVAGIAFTAFVFDTVSECDELSTEAEWEACIDRELNID